MRAHGVSVYEYADDTQGYLPFRLGGHGEDQWRAVEQMVQCVSEVDGWLSINMLKKNIE